ncbi:MAG: hypothetical protein ABTQ25_15825 [Nitrosomonas ureae]
MRKNPIGIEVKPDCCLCGKPGETLYRNRTDYLFGTPGEWSFRICRGNDCGLVWLDPRPVVNEIGKAYENYYTHDKSGHVIEHVHDPLSLLESWLSFA